MKSRSMWSWVILTLFVIVPMVFVANLATGPQSVARGKAATLPLTDEMTAEQQLAQDAALADPRVQAYTTGHRTEVFGVQTISHQTNPALAACASADCRQVNIFNFDESATIAAIVNVQTGEVLDVLHQPGIRPLINKRLADRAMEIALSAPEVSEILGDQPLNSDWAPMDSTLVGTACETGHMCVAPTFDLGDYILWAIVDLTDEKFVDLFWTAIEPEESARSNPYPYREELGCVATPGSVTRNGWSVAWETTAHDGFHVYNATHNGNAVLTSAKTVEWHADYGSSGYQDSTGCSGGGGGFLIRPYGNTRQTDITDGSSNVIGFELIQDFRMGSWGNYCNYRYEQIFQFYDDGRYRVMGLAYGKGCGKNSLYRPIIRMDVAAGGDAAGDSLDYWNGTAWTAQATEIRQGSTNVVNPDGYGWRLTDDAGGGYYIEPGRGQFGDNGLGDNEYLYAVQYKVGEGDGDLGIFGAGCCNDNAHGPEIYVNGESIANQNIVLWYVPQMMTQAAGPNYYCWTVTTTETYPCYAGPMFVPIAAVTTPTAAYEYNGGAAGPVATASTVQFTNTSTGGGTMTFDWDFGDGTPHATTPNPTHAYATAGSYDVTLTVTNEMGTDAVTASLTVIDAVIAGSSHQATTSVGQPTQFTDASTGGGTLTYLWDFGDGNSSTLASPLHTYNATGTFNVTLTVTNEVSSDTATSSIQVLPPTAVTLGGLSAERSGLPMLMLWGLGGLLAMGIALTRIAAMRRR